MNTAVTQKLKCPIAVELIISEDKLNEEKNSGNGLFSEWFDASNIPGVRYRIGIFFFLGDAMIGPNSLETGKTWFFYFELNKRNIDAVFNMTIKSANYVLKKHLIPGKKDIIEEKLCTTEELFDPEKRFIVDGKMTVYMDGILSIEKEAENEILLQFDDTFDSKLGLALWEQENKDFIISAGGKEIHAHKNVLAARSPVFSRMFVSGMKEAKENKVTIEDFTFNIVEKAIKLCYHQSLVPYSTLEEKTKLLQFFEKYDIQPLKDILEKYLISVLNEFTVCRLTNAALLSNATKLEMKCKKFLRSCFKKTKPITDFDILDKDFALNLLKNAFIHVSECESIV
uniref:BTB domain-containing protein n=1 Tax=Panagrolaimus davidi TaxID=227884 RepID=A0A914QQ88_9BILA